MRPAPPSHLDTVVHTSPATLGPLLDGWRALADDLALPYCTPEWMLAFWHHRHAARTQLRVVEVRRDDELVGVAPFYLERARLGPSQLWLLGSGIGQRSAPLAAPGFEEDVAAATAATLGSGRRIAAIQLPAAPTAAWARAFADRWPAPLRLEAVRNEPGLCVTTAGDHDAWLAGRSSNYRKKRAKRLRGLASAGITVRVSTRATIAADLAAMFALHRARFADVARASSITADVEAAVTDAAAGLLARDRCVHLVLERDGEVVAGDLYLVAGDRMCGWNGGFDPAVNDLSPGMALLDEAVRLAHARGLGTVDLGAGDQDFKQRVADRTEDLHWARLTAQGPSAALLRLEGAGAAARRRARSVRCRLAVLAPAG